MILLTKPLDSPQFKPCSSASSLLVSSSASSKVTFASSFDSPSAPFSCSSSFKSPWCSLAKPAFPEVDPSSSEVPTSSISISCPNFIGFSPSSVLSSSSLKGCCSTFLLSLLSSRSALIAAGSSIRPSPSLIVLLLRTNSSWRTGGAGTNLVRGSVISLASRTPRFVWEVFFE